jgi:hypothetical protein
MVRRVCIACHPSNRQQIWQWAFPLFVTVAHQYHTELAAKRRSTEVRMFCRYWNLEPSPAYNFLFIWTGSCTEPTVCLISHLSKFKVTFNTRRNLLELTTEGESIVHTHFSNIKQNYSQRIRNGSAIAMGQNDMLWNVPSTKGNKTRCRVAKPTSSSLTLHCAFSQPQNFIKIFYGKRLLPIKRRPLCEFKIAIFA